MKLTDLLTRTGILFALASPIVACGGVEDELAAVAETQDAATVGPIVLSRIAYRSGYDVHSMASDGTDDELLTSGSHPSYSDGRTRLVYADGGAIKVVDAPFDAAAFANAQVVYSGTGDWAGVDPSISLDGTRVTFATAGLAGYGATLFVYTIGTNNPVTLIDGSGTWVYNPVFTADGSYVAYNVGNPSYSLSIRRVLRTVVNQPAATAGVQLVSNGYRPAFSPNGSRLAFYRSVAGRGYDIYLADANGANAAAYAGNSDYDDMDPTFSPSSGSLAFISKRDYWSCRGYLCYHGNEDHLGRNLWRGTTSGGSLDNLTSNASNWLYIGSPSWQ